MREGAASIYLEPHDLLGYDGAKALFVLMVAKAGGIQLQLVDPPADPLFLFTFSDSDVLPLAGDANRGLSDETQSTGGALNGVRG
jgi:hypothetical protein